MPGSNYSVAYIYKILDQYSETLARIEKNTEKFGDAAHKATEKAHKGMGLFGKAVASMLTAEGITKLTEQTIHFVEESIKVFENAEVTYTQIKTMISNTHGALGKTFEQMRSDAEKTASTSTVSVMNIMSGVQKPLLRFGNLTGDTFTKVQNAAVNMAEGMFGVNVNSQQLQTVSLALGRAMADPEHGMMRLARMGITFNDVQRKVIKDLVQSGRLHEAQALILGQVEGKYKDSAANLMKTGAGLNQNMKNQIEELQLKIGETFEPVKFQLMSLAVNVLPILSKAFEVIVPIISALITAFTFVAGLIERHKVLFMILAGILGVVAIALNIAAIAEWALNIAMMFNPITLIILGIALLVVGILMLADHFKEIGAFFVKLWNNIVKFFKGIVNSIIGFFRSMWETFSKLLDNPLFRIISLIFLPFITIPALIIKNWANITKFFGDVFKAIMNNPVFKFIGGLFGGGKTDINVKTPNEVPGVPKNNVNVNSSSTISVYKENGVAVVPYKKGNNLGYQAVTN